MKDTDVWLKKALTDQAYESALNFVHQQKVNQASARNIEKQGLILDEELHSAKAATAAAKSSEEILNTPAGRIIRKIGTLRREMFGDGNVRMPRSIGGRKVPKQKGKK